MKFLTEYDLRVEYHNFPFDTFTIQKNTRLTPGARTFLADRKIKIIDENEQITKKRNNLDSPLKEEESSKDHCITHTPTARHQAEWFGIRCELLKTAYDLASTDMPLAEELKIIERCLALAMTNESCSPPPITMVNTEAVQMDKTAVIGNLSTVGMFLQTNKGHVLTRLYPIYFRLDAWVEQLDTSAQPYLLEVIHRLEQLIAYYLTKSEEVK